MNKPIHQPVEGSRPAPAVPDTPERAWITPAITDLPRLVDLTLQTGGGIPGDCGIGGGGSTCF